MYKKSGMKNNYFETPSHGYNNSTKKNTNNTNKKANFIEINTQNKKKINKSSSTINLNKDKKYETKMKSEKNYNDNSQNNLLINNLDISNRNINIKTDERNINEKSDDTQKIVEGRLDGFLEIITKKFNKIIAQNEKILTFNNKLNDELNNLKNKTSEIQNQLNKNNEKYLQSEIIKLQEKEKKYGDEISYYKEQNNKLNEQIRSLKDENKKLKEEIKKKEIKLNDTGKKTYYNSQKNIFDENFVNILNINRNNLIGLKPVKEAPYLNSFFQCLNQTELLKNYILNNKNINNNMMLSSELKIIFQKFSKQDEKIFDLHVFFKKISNVNNDYFQNLYKFLNFFIFQLHKELNSDLIQYNNFNFKHTCEIKSFKESIKNNNTKIDEIFQIIYEKAIQCSKKKIKYDYHFDSYKFLCFELSKSRFKCDEISLEECVKFKREKGVFQKKEFCKLCNDDCYVLHFRRFLFSNVIIFIFSYDEKKNEYIKLNFKEQINLANYTKWEEDNNNKNKLIYNLYGVITLVKDNSGDKYIYLCKNKENNNWYRIDDENIYYINDVKNDVFNYGKPLILFYNKD